MSQQILISVHVVYLILPYLILCICLSCMLYTTIQPNYSAKWVSLHEGLCVFKVICASCSRHCLPLAYRAYRRSRVCDNCDVILKHKTQQGLGCHDNASSPAAATAAGDAAVCSIDEELLNRNNQPLGSNVSQYFNLTAPFYGPSCCIFWGRFRVRQPIRLFICHV